MELPTCPECSQSVLDEDATECPFCGASMSGSPSAGRSAAKPAAAASGSPASSKGPQKASAGASSSKSAAVKSAGARKTPAGGGKGSSPKADDDPFAVEKSAPVRAIRLAPRQMKGRTFAVTCPMCETTGYAPPKAAGKDVLCANKECLVPNFTAPELPPDPTPVEQPRRFTSTHAIFAILILCLLIGGGVWGFVLTKKEVTEIAPWQPPDTPTAPVVDPTQLVGVDKKDDKTPDNGGTTRERTIAELHRAAIENMVKLSREQSENRSKAYCRRATAEACALLGDTAAAREQLESLQVVGSHVPYYRILPLVDIFHAERAAGNTEQANVALDQALAEAPGLPQFGRFPLDASTVLAAALVEVDRSQEASALIGKHSSSDHLGQLSAELVIVRETDHDNLDRFAHNRPVLAWSAPQWVAVTRLAAAQGAWDQALAWAKSNPDSAGRTEAVVGWAETVAAADEFTPEQKTERLTAATESLDRAGQAMLWARVGQAWFQQVNSDAARDALGKADQAAGGLSAPSPMTLPSMKDLTAFKLPDPADGYRHAASLAETARLHARMGSDDAAWPLVLKALDAIRATAPSVAETEARQREAKSLTNSRLGDQLRALLELKSADAADRAQRAYRRRLVELHEAAVARRNKEVELLAGMAGEGLADRILELVQQRTSADSAAERTAYRSTPLPWILLLAAQESGNNELASQIETDLKNAELSPPPFEKLRLETARMVRGGSLAAAAKAINAGLADRTDQSRWALRLACRLTEGDVNQSFLFVRTLTDPIVREDAFTMIAALAGRQDQSRDVWKLARAGSVPPADNVALYRGFVEGTRHLKSEEAATPPAEVDGESQKKSGATGATTQATP